MWWRSLRQKSGLSSHCLPSALSSLGQACSCRKVDARDPSLSRAHCRPMTMHACRCRKAEEGSSKTRHAFKRARVKGNFLPPWKSIPSKGSKAIHFPFSGLWSFFSAGSVVHRANVQSEKFSGRSENDFGGGCTFLSAGHSLTSFPLCWADLVSRKVYTSPQTEISRQTPGCDSSVKPPLGCITRTPLVVSPSMWPSGFFHFAAFSWKAAHRAEDTYSGNVRVHNERSGWVGVCWG